MKRAFIAIMAIGVSSFAQGQWTGSNPISVNDNVHIQKKLGVGTNLFEQNANIFGQYAPRLADRSGNFYDETTGIRITHRYQNQINNQWNNYSWDIATNHIGMHFRYNNSEATHLFINKSGRVGVGTTAPYDLLDVKGNQRWSYSYTQYSKMFTDAQNTYLDHNGNGKLMVNMNSHKDAQFGGEVQACLVRTSEVVVESGWCDYVFEDTYKLMSIDQLSQYIRENKHLPNIPAAKHVEENGLEMADMQRRMMEKIEEMSLYVIQLNDRIKEQEETIKAQQAQIDSLKK